MSILVVTASAARRGLTTVATVKRELGITGSADHDFLEDLILQASPAIEGWCRRVFGREEVYRDVPSLGRTGRAASRPLAERGPRIRSARMT